MISRPSLPGSVAPSVHRGLQREIAEREGDAPTQVDALLYGACTAVPCRRNGLVPSALADVWGRPLLRRTLDRLAALGAGHAVLAVDDCTAYVEHLRDARWPEMSVSLAPGPARGLMTRVSSHRGRDERDLIVMRSSVHTTVDLSDLLLHHRRTGAHLTIAAVERMPGPSQTVLQTAGDRLTGTTARFPTDSYPRLVSADLCIASPHVQALFPADVATTVAAIVAIACRARLNCRIYAVTETWLDLDSADDFRELQTTIIGRRHRG